jgi:cell division septum initiation protein DivIVA
MEEPPIPSVEKRKTTVSKIPGAEGNKDLDIVIKDLEQLQQEVSDKIGPKNTKELASKIDKIKEDYNAKSGEEQTKTLYKNLQSLKDWSSEKGKKTNDKSTWKKIGTVISSCISLVAAKIAGKEVETIKNNLAQAMKELKTQGKKEVVEGLSKINTRAAENQQRGR